MPGPSIFEECSSVNIRQKDDLDTSLDPSSFPPKYFRPSDLALEGISGTVKLGRVDRAFPG